MPSLDGQRAEGVGGNDGSSSTVARVLDAERRAEDAVAEAEQQAAQVLEAAREEARRIGRRAERRVLGLRAHFGERIEAEIACLEATEAARIERIERLQFLPDRIRAAARRVARWLVEAG